MTTQERKSLKVYRMTQDGRDPKIGAFEYGGRWNSKGIEAIYGSLHYSTCLLEILVRQNTTKSSSLYVFSEIFIPLMNIEIVHESDVKGWDDIDQVASREFGDQWLQEKRTAALMVPSMVARPIDFNIVINPLHENFKKITWSKPLPVPQDARIFKKA